MYLDLALRTARIDTLIISGGSTGVGVASTVFAGRDLDYHMIVVVRDVCATVHDQRAHDVLTDLILIQPKLDNLRNSVIDFSTVRRFVCGFQCQQVNSSLARIAP